MRKNQTAIAVSNLGKCYHIYDKPQDRLKQVIFRRKKPYYREFWALKGVSFTLRQGEALGIIGRNGSGKSTLLQMLCKTLTPTTGQIIVNGSIAALLELGAGFNPEFTGRENVYLNGAILGFSHQEMEARFDAICAFADIGNFIDQPVKTYSSGMFVRLAFAVQVEMNPDILIIDEALSVGDVFFQQKCIKRMQQLRDQGTSLIFVSHDMATIRDLCDKALYLKNGELIFAGTSGEAVIKYFADSQAKIENPLENRPKSPEQASSHTQFIEQFKASACWVADQSHPTQKEAEIIAIAVTDQQNFPTLQAQMTETLKFRVLYRTHTNNPVHTTLMLRNRYNHIINMSGSYTCETTLPILQMGDYAIFEIDMTCMIEAGLYTFSINLGYTTDTPNQGCTLDESPWLGPLTVTWDYEKNKAPWFGMFGIPVTTTVKPLENINVTERIT